MGTNDRFERVVVGANHEQSLIVTQNETALHQGSGNQPVLSTPDMIALMEGTAVAAVAPLLPEGYDTVGIGVDIKHLAATVPGTVVTAKAVLVEIDGRQLVFEVEAHDPGGLIGKGRHERFVIHAERFMQRARERMSR